MEIYKKLSAVFFAVTLFSINHVQAEDNTSTLENSKTCHEITIYKSELTSIKKELEEIHSRLSSAPLDVITTNTAKVEQNDSKVELSSPKEVVAAVSQDAKNEVAAISQNATVASLDPTKNESLISAANTTDLYVTPAEETPKHNKYNHNLWKSKNEEQVLLEETQIYNQNKFVAQLTPLARNEWSQFTREQKQSAMELADGTTVSPDQAVFITTLNY